MRAEIQRLVQERPFRRSLLTLESGHQVVIEHPENIAFNPSDGTTEGSRDFYVISGSHRVYGTFEAVTSITTMDVAGSVTETGDSQ